MRAPLLLLYFVPPSPQEHPSLTAGSRSAMAAAASPRSGETTPESANQTHHHSLHTSISPIDLPNLAPHHGNPFFSGDLTLLDGGASRLKTTASWRRWSMERLGTLKIDRERAGGAVYARNRTEIERGRRISVKIRELELGEKVSGRMTMSCTEQYLFKFLPPSGPPPHACMLAAGTHPNRRVALVQIVAARCTEPDEHELGSVSVPLS